MSLLFQLFVLYALFQHMYVYCLQSTVYLHKQPLWGWGGGHHVPEELTMND